MKDLAMQNKCLLLKLLHRLHNPGESAWAVWVRSKMDLVTMHGELAGTHWQDLEDLLPMYRAVTACEVGNGEDTSFWGDRWLAVGRLSVQFPLLFSHATTTEVSVASVLGAGIEHFLVPRLSAGARAELATLRVSLMGAQLNEGADRRFSLLACEGDALRAGPIYRLSMQTLGADQCEFTEFVWRNRAPPRVQFFAWLLARQRLNCRANLSAKHLLDDAKCEVCSVEDEDCQHLILSCPFASQAWHALGMDAGRGEVTKLWAFPRPTSIPSKHFDSFVLLICWNLWKHRNEVIFRSLPPSHRRLWDACRSEAREWSYRWKREDYIVCDAWCAVFSNM